MTAIMEGNDWKNQHDSSLGFGEMRELILRICNDIPGMDNPPPTMPAEFKKLSAALRNIEDKVVFLVNGIHQADELHYNLKCAYAGNDSQFHVYIAQGTKRNVRTAPLTQTPLRDKRGLTGQYAEVPLFEYKNTGLSWQQHGSSPRLLWPAVFEKNGYAGRQRGKSFSIGNSAPIAVRGPNPKTETLLGP